MPNSIAQTLNTLDAAVRRADFSDAAMQSAILRSSFGRLLVSSERTATQLRRYQELLDRAVHLASLHGAKPVAREALDTIIDVVQARRGVIGTVENGHWTVLVAHNDRGEPLEAAGAQVSSSIIERAVSSGEPVITHDATEELTARSVHNLNLRSVICLPLHNKGAVVGFVYLDHSSATGQFDAAALDAVQSWLPLVAGHVTREREQTAPSGLPGVLTRSSRMQATLGELARVAKFDVPVLLTGETGTGKSLVARQLHAASPRSHMPFIHVNCGALPEALIVAELFGAEHGAYTGTKGRRIGRFEAANGGTLFLDELDAMPLDCQVKLLVALQERRVTRLGSNTPIDVDVRLIAATNRDPHQAILNGVLREDLYYRLAVFVSHLLPLRERPEDIALLTEHFLRQTRERYHLPPIRLAAAAQRTLLSHDWPGNVRELVNTLDRAALLSEDGVIEQLRIHRSSSSSSTPTASGSFTFSDALRQAASLLVTAMMERHDLRD
ncbi:MAG: transcriptional regulator with GAF, ATPase, and Fis domain, partial [Kiritimatiellia bacterium]